MSPDLEIRQLKETIISLREELEKARFEAGDQAEAAVAAASEEVRQLRAGIIGLRDQLELCESQRKEKLRQAELEHDHEKAELHRTITALRERLQELNDTLEKIRRSGGTAAVRASG